MSCVRRGTIRGDTSRDRRPCATHTALLVACLLLGCGAQRSGDESPTVRSPVSPTYARDLSFPGPSGVTFDLVSWVQRHDQSGLIYVLQRSAPPVSAWTPEGALVSTWSTQALGDPHSISFHSDPLASTTVWITDMAPPLLPGRATGIA